MSAGGWGWLILLFPLGGMLLISLFWRALPGRSAGWLGSAAIGGSFVASVGAFLSLLDKDPHHRVVTSNAFDYAKTSGVEVDVGILVDPLSVFMCLVVSGVSFLIHVYSVAYMGSDEGYRRFFAYLNYFVFSMLLLVLAGNFVLLIVGWAFVGAASYLLISFWYRRRTATAAGIKAFVMNVIGDVGLVVGAFLLFDQTGALDYAGVFEGVHDIERNDGTLVAACILLLVGAFAKSAQIPLHTWLPDAMEGPTPVSALIHAATMVTAGVYLIARMHPLFEQAPATADVAAIGGTVTLVVAATIALVVTDLKRVIAYSTMSQIGYMVLGVGMGAYVSGLFHLMTHAFFKALLFMGAGSVIGAMGGEQSLDRMGGFRRAMPFTFATFTIGALALAAFPPMSGLFSKDAILAFGIHRGGLYLVLSILGYVAAALTAFYAFRMVFRVFWGDPVEQAEELEHGHLWHPEEPTNPATGEVEDTDVGYPGPEHHVAEQSVPMRMAMAPLAVLSVVAGIVFVPGVTKWLEKWLHPSFEESRLIESHPSVGAEWAGLAVGSVLAIAGIAVAYSMFVRRPGVSLDLRDRMRAVHDFFAAKWYFDEAYELLFVRPSAAFGRFGRGMVESALVQGLLVGGASGIVRSGTAFARAIQTGALRAYALLLMIGLGGLALYFLIVSS
ncbi:MAG: NADH-quinone oxidoreductase subunit L [Actinomycetota bacterium]|nr:NADH-quinone oxidoreductase subunit L [Actinomycetota bacterium]